MRICACDHTCEEHAETGCKFCDCAIGYRLPGGKQRLQAKQKVPDIPPTQEELKDNENKNSNT